MKTLNKTLYFLVLPIVGILAFPLNYYSQGLVVMGIVSVLIIGLGLFVWRGSQRALTFSIFLNGMNVIVRLMMLLSTVVSKQGIANLEFGIAGLLGLLISFYLMLRLDQTDVRKYVDIQALGLRKAKPAK